MLHLEVNEDCEAVDDDGRCILCPDCALIHQPTTTLVMARETEE